MTRGNYKTSEKVFCVICGEEIKDAGNRLKMFCSEKCRYEHIKNTRIKYRTCRACGKEFKVTTHYRFFCSDECKAIVNKINMKNSSIKPEIREQRRQHARQVRQTEKGYIYSLFARNRLRGNCTFTYEEIKELYNTTNKCFYCGKETKPYTVDKQIDHKIPLSRGGKNSIGNMVICCKACNSGKCDKTDIEYKNFLKEKRIETN